MAITLFFQRVPFIMASRLGLYSHYSLNYGVHSFEKWVDVCKKEGVDTIAISDINSIYGMHHMREVALEEEIHLIISATFTTEIGPIWVLWQKERVFSSHLFTKYTIRTQYH